MKFKEYIKVPIMIFFLQMMIYYIFFDKRIANMQKYKLNKVINRKYTQFRKFFNTDYQREMALGQVQWMVKDE